MGTLLATLVLPLAAIAQSHSGFPVDITLGHGRLFHADKNSNENFYGYSAEVLAVADGRVSDLKDGLPENSGSNERSSGSITLENVVGTVRI